MLSGVQTAGDMAFLTLLDSITACIIFSIFMFHQPFANFHLT